MFRSSLIFCLVLCSTLIYGENPWRSSYLVLLQPSAERAREDVVEYSRRLKQDLEDKLSRLNVTAVLNKVNEDDKLWISQAVRIDLDQDQVKQIASNPAVLGVIPDGPIFLSAPIPGQNLMNTGKFTYGLESLEVPEVWERYGFRGNGVTVGVIDTGWADHADLRGKVLRSKDFISKFEDNKPNDDQGHGTHCMGSIGGGSESGKSIGVAPEVKFIVAKIFDSKGRSSRSAILKAMQWITDPDGNPDTKDYPRVISNSWGKQYEGFEKELEYRRATRIWREYGIAPIFAAGNSGPSKNTVVSPAALDTTLAVAAVDEKDKIASFSSRGAVEWEDGKVLQKPDIAAPGVDVYSASHKGGYVAYSGTSMACPHVAGVAALMLQANPDLTVDALFAILKQSALELGEPGWDIAYGHGKISALRAVEIALSLGYVNLNIKSQGAPVRIRVLETGQVYRFRSGEDFKLHMKEGDYHFLIQSFGSLDEKVAVEVKKGESSSLEVELKKAQTFTWNLKVINEKGVPINAQLHFPEIPVDIQAIPVEGAEIKLPASCYHYHLKAYGYIPISSEIELSSDTSSVLKMSALKPLLIVNASGSEIHSSYLKSSIPREFGYDYSNKHRSITLEELQRYRRVLWFTGSKSNGSLQFDRRQALKTYFESGGVLILSGQNTQENIGPSDFTEQLFGIRVIQKNSNQRRLMGLGSSMVLNDNSSAKNHDSPEEVAVFLEGTQIILNWANGKGALSERIQGNGRAFYMGFGLEGLSRNDRTRLAKILLERSEPSLLSELLQAQKSEDPDLRARFFNSASILKPTNQREASQALEILQAMGLEDSALYDQLGLYLRFQKLHEN